MKSFLLKAAILPAFLGISFFADAQNIHVDNLYYKVTSATDLTVGVVSATPKYSGNVEIPATVTYDGKNYKVTSVEQYAFALCTELNSVKIGSNIVTIGTQAFFNDSKMVKLDFSEAKALETIGERAFYNCAGLVSVVLPDKCKSLGLQCFQGCTTLSAFTCGSGLEKIGQEAFSQDSKLSVLVLNEGLKEIGKNAFGSCSGLISLTIPNSVETITQGAFMACKGLTSVTLGSGLKSIGSLAFTGPDNLKTVRCDAVVPPSAPGAFSSSIYSSATLIVPSASEEAYKNAEGWKKFSAFSGIGDIISDGSDNVRYFDLQGRRVENPAEGNVYIRISNGKAEKILK